MSRVIIFFRMLQLTCVTLMGEEQYCIVTLNSTFYLLSFVQLAFYFAICLSFRLFSSNELVANMLGQSCLVNTIWSISILRFACYRRSCCNMTSSLQTLLPWSIL